ncbi:MAG: B12-binding domain-containing protein [Chloroflexi bacterium]|nr:B12-binding domain-containing protein [Chloroflexota bacterium]MCL5074992.1 B12-binding domain-containing protein [Chloroflexota bacterium]
MSDEATLQALARAIVAGDVTAATAAAEQALQEGIPPVEAVEKGLLIGMRTVGDKWRAFEIWLPEVMLAVEAWKAAMAVLEPRMTRDNKETLRAGTVVIGTVKGDIHEIGKNIVATLLKAAGFEVYDLGSDIAASAFVEAAERTKADIIACSALMTTTMPNQKDVIEHLKGQGLREKYQVMVGGAPVDQLWANKIGADGYGATADDAVKVALQLMSERKRG